MVRVCVVVSKAFQVLSDSNMRAAYDQHGADPESRFSGMSSPSSRGPGFHANSFGGETEITPEELFNMFFGGNMGGGGFGGPGKSFFVHKLTRRIIIFVQCLPLHLAVLV